LEQERYTPEEAQEEAALVKERYDNSPNIDYSQAEAKVEKSLALDKITNRSYAEIISAKENTVSFTSEQNELILTFSEQSGTDPEVVNSVIHQLKIEGVSNDDIIRFLPELTGSFNRPDILHRAAIFSREAQQIRSVLGIEIDDSASPENFLYHGTKPGPELSNDELQSFITEGINMSKQQGGVDTFMGDTDLATTLKTSVSGYGTDMFRINVLKLIEGGYSMRDLTDPGGKEKHIVVDVPE